MAVYPDRIILKNSTDAQATIEAAIGSGGADEIVYGELVIGRETGSAQLYTVDATGAIVTISGGGGGSSSVIVSPTAPTQRPDASPLEEGDQWWDSDDELLYVYVSSVWTLASTGGPAASYDVAMDGGDFDTGLTDNTNTIFDNFPISIDAHSDVDTTTTPPTNGQALVWNGVDNWVPGNVAASVALNDLTDVTITAAATGEVLRYNGSAWVDAQLAYSDLSGAPDIVLDTTPQLGGNLDVNGNQITSTANGNVSIAPNGTGVLEVRGNTNDGSLKLNCTANTHGVTIKSPPHAAAATYTLVLPTSAGLADQVLKTDGSGNLGWVDQSGGGGAINDLSDVDTATSPPTVDQVLAWDGANWVPANQTGSGGGSVVGTIVRKTESQTAASSAATFSAIGASGLLVSFTSDIDAWIVLYPTAADRTADAGRAYGTDPTPGSGVLAEAFVAAGTTVLASPGTAYFNNDTTSSDAIYAAVRDQAGAAANATVTIVAYAHQTFAGTGTNRVTDSGTAASGALDLTGLGQTGQLCTVTSSLNAWIVLYGSDADRTADAGRAFNTDPTTGSGVMAEFYITAGTTILATPGTGYFNNDTNPTDAVYLAVRDQAGAAVNSLVTVTAYAETSYTGVSGGTFGSG